jgi:hypothetical protein
MGRAKGGKKYLPLVGRRIGLFRSGRNGRHGFLYGASSAAAAAAVVVAVGASGGGGGSQDV